MTDNDRISIIAYVRERLDTVDAKLAEAKVAIDRVHIRIESLEVERAGRQGRNGFIAAAAKTVAAFVAAVLAALGIKSQIG